MPLYLTRPATLALAFCLLLACDSNLRSRAEPRASTPSAATAPSGATPSSAAAEAPSNAAPTEVAPSAASSGERRFGAAPKLAGEALPVAALLASPEEHVGKTVKCTGLVARVCQAAGCWLELQPSGGGEGLRVPMAQHAFFIPQDALGQLAVVEGELKRQPLAAEQRDHYASEGMKAMGPLSLEATSVVLH
jgi:hypothetical protein